MFDFLQEEFEDSKGNVMSRKMYDDLRRQGILWANIVTLLFYLILIINIGKN